MGHLSEDCTVKGVHSWQGLTDTVHVYTHIHVHVHVHVDYRLACTSQLHWMMQLLLSDNVALCVFVGCLKHACYLRKVFHPLDRQSVSRQLAACSSCFQLGCLVYVSLTPMTPVVVAET